MDKSFEPNDGIEFLANSHVEGDDRIKHAEPAASGPARLLTESDYESLADRSSLGTRLANITSRLLRELACGGDPIPHAGTGKARAVVGR